MGLDGTRVAIRLVGDKPSRGSLNCLEGKRAALQQALKGLLERGVSCDGQSLTGVDITNINISKVGKTSGGETWLFIICLVNWNFLSPDFIIIFTGSRLYHFCI